MSGDQDPADDLLLTLPGRLDGAWRSFTAELAAKFPAAAWPDERLATARQQLLDEASRDAEAGTALQREHAAEETSERYRTAAEKRVNATEMGVVLAMRGASAGEADVYDMMRTFDRVLSGEGPERRIVTVRGPDGIKRDAVLEDEESDRIGIAFWERAAKYALPRAVILESGEASFDAPLTEWIANEIARADLEQDMDVEVPESSYDVDFDP